MWNGMDNCMKELKLVEKEINKFRKGYPLITKDSNKERNKLIEEGTLFKVLDRNNNYVATAYYGLQNKGSGWVLSRDEKEVIDDCLFKNKIDLALKCRRHCSDDMETTVLFVFNDIGERISRLTIDYYNGYYLINWYSEGIYSFRKAVYQSLQKAVNYHGIYEKKRFDT